MMKTWIKRSGIAALLCCCAAVASAAQEEAKERDVEMQRYNIVYRIQPDGSYTEEREQAVTVLKPTALEQVKEATISYSTSIQKIEVLQAYTLKPDGRRIDVSKSNFQVQINGGHGDGAPVFSDMTTMTVVFPEISVGDTAVLSYRLTGSQPMFDGHFSTAETFSRTDYYGEVNLSFDAPAQLPVHYEAWHMDKVRDEETDGRRILQWRYSNTAPLKPDMTDTLFEFERHPGVAYSTFASYGDIAKAYGARATAKAAVTPRIQQLADEIAGSRKEPREIGQALYEWVSTQITYAGNCIGLGAVVPHDLDFVLDNKMGDCKDQATLLQALLAAKGIQSTQALINAGGVYSLTKTPVASMVNHVINYVPDWNMYLDPTAEGIPFGMLPEGDIGKPVFLIDGYKDGTQTPVPPIGTNRQIIRTHLKIAADGSVEGEMDIHLEGMHAVRSRASFRNINRERMAQSINAYFQRMGSTGSGSIDLDDPTALSDRYHYKLRFKVAQVLPVPGALPLRPWSRTPAPVSDFAAQAGMEIADEGNAICNNGYSREEYDIEFAPKMKIMTVPPNMKISGAETRYTAQYKRQGNRLTATREIDDRTPGPVCTQQSLREYKALMQKVLSNVKAQVVYQ